MAYFFIYPFLPLACHDNSNLVSFEKRRGVCLTYTSSKVGAGLNVFQTLTLSEPNYGPRF